MKLHRLAWVCALLLVALSLMVGCRFGGGDFDGDADGDDDVVGDDDTSDDDSGDDDDDSGDDDDDDDATYGTPFDPPSIYGAVVGMDGGRMVVYGGGTATGGTAATDALWVMSETESGFAPLQLGQTGDVPPALIHAAGGYDAENDILFVYGGQTADGNAASGAWAASMGTDPVVWTGFATDPGTRVGAASAIAEVGDTHALVVFGGERGGAYLNDLWFFDIDEGTWEQVQTSGGSTPPARAYAAMVFDPGQQSLWLFGGGGDGGFLDDTWKFNAQTGALRWVAFPVQTARPSPRIGMSAAMDATNTNGVFFGGGNSGYDDGLYVLELNPGSQFWFRPEVTGQTPPGRRFGQFAWDEDGGRFWLYGGLTAESVFGDFWTIPAADLNQWAQGQLVF